VIEWLSPPPGFDPPILKQHRKRFSEILPYNPFLYVAFRVIRTILGEGPFGIPEWTRSWKCKWKAQILRGSNRGKIRVSMNRKELIDWEHDQWITNLRNQ
jgi:hypothetical protein